MPNKVVDQSTRSKSVSNCSARTNLLTEPQLTGNSFRRSCSTRPQSHIAVRRLHQLLPKLHILSQGLIFANKPTPSDALRTSSRLESKQFEQSSCDDRQLPLRKVATIHSSNASRCASHWASINTSAFVSLLVFAEFSLLPQPIKRLTRTIAR